MKLTIATEDAALSAGPMRAGFVTLLMSGTVVIGLAIRIALFPAQGSLHMDEAAVARNIMERSWWELASPLSYRQAAPLLYLWSCKLAVQFLGVGEWQLRLPALIAGLASMILFAVLARRLLRPAAAVAATGLFAVLPASIHYSAFTKPYTFDLLVAMVLLLVALEWHQRQGVLRWTFLAVGGMVASWCSFSSPMVMAGLGTAISLKEARQRRWPQLAAVGVCCALWLCSFAMMWLLIGSRSAADFLLQDLWKNAFVPLIPTGSRDAGVMIYHFFHFFESPFLSPYGHPRADMTSFAAGLMTLLCLIGASELWRRNRSILLMLVLPVLFTWAASSLHRYPFRWRFLLFLAPMILVLGAIGMQMLAEWAISRRRLWLAWTMPALVFVIAMANSGQLFFRHPGTDHRMRHVLADMAGRVQSGDVVVVHDGSQLAFEFYRQFIDECRLGDVSVVSTGPTTDLLRRVRDSDHVRGRPRVWYVYEHEWMLFPDYYPDLGIWSALVERDGAREMQRIRSGDTVAVLFDYSQVPVDAPAEGQ